MSERDVRILFVGDMHLGTRLSRLPATGTDPETLGPAEAWERTVDAALDRGVRAVALAGDVVNRHNELFEAKRPLDRGLARLSDAGIIVVAVAGNHDTATLPPLARRDPRLTLLGEGGVWETCELDDGAGPPVHIVGWSFPREHWSTSPLNPPPPAPRYGAVTLGLLHADLGVADSRYAPVTSAEFDATGYTGWFLGHVHTPGRPVIDGRPFYLGSLTPLDPTETGEHGPVLVTVRADGGLAAERLPLAPLRWERWKIACDFLTAPEEDLQSVLLAGIEQRLDELDPAPGVTLGLRMRLTGEVSAPLAVARAAAALPIEMFETEISGVPVFVDRVDCEVRGRVDLTALAGGTDPAALLARRILALENEDPGTDPRLVADTLERARGAVGAVDAIPACRRLGDAPTDADLRRMTARSARRLLDRMLGDESGQA